MIHRDRAGDPPGQRAGRREAAGPGGHRHGFPPPAGGAPARPERWLPKAFGLPMALRRGAWLPMSRIATPRAAILCPPASPTGCLRCQHHKNQGQYPISRCLGLGLRQPGPWGREK